MATVAVIGSGAVGCYYGAKLARGGHDVRFLMRRDLDAVRHNGLSVYSCDGDFRLPEADACASPAEIGIVDWVICSLKSTALAEAPALIAPCVGPATRVIALMNGLGVEDELAPHFGAERVFGAMAFVCINRGEPGVVHHLKYGRLTIGHAEDDAREVTEAAAFLASGAIDAVPAPDLLCARWEKLCWNIPFNGLSVAGGGIGTELIVTDPDLRATAERTMREVVAAANADLAAHGREARLDADEIVPRMFALTDTMGDYRTSMAIDYVSGNALEVDRILGEPLRRARALGIDTPTMAALHALVRTADLRRRGLVPAVTQEELGRGTSAGLSERRNPWTFATSWWTASSNSTSGWTRRSSR